MKLHKIITGMLLMLMISFAQATTLKFPTDLNLLVLDGHKISGAFLKGADGLVLEQGEHQILFRVEKTLLTSANQSIHWAAPLQIVTFTASSHTVQIQLPKLTSLHAMNAFSHNPKVVLLNEHNHPIVTKQDVLNVAANTDLEQVMMQYNRNSHTASVPRFAAIYRHNVMHTEKQQDLTVDQTSTAERMLHLWYQQVDTATRQHLMTFMQALHTS